ncbi:hypothetical protein FOCC_FOCC001105 [Frankliniella occidentalis]|nr:hypothetical protein FOCC_FOCC001105 [Frankliniella occidentalis]
MAESRRYEPRAAATAATVRLQLSQLRRQSADRNANNNVLAPLAPPELWLRWAGRQRTRVPSGYVREPQMRIFIFTYNLRNLQIR